MERRTRRLDRGLVAVAFCMASAISAGCLTPEEGLEEESAEVASVQQEALHSVLGYFMGPKSGRNYPVYYGAYGDGYDHCTNDGINPATCNGSNRTGMRWQCVEWAVRFMHFEFGTSKPWGVSAAKYMCSTHPSTVRTISTNSLKPGDLYVNGGGTYGHVAVVKQVNRDSAGNVTSVRTVDQNFYGCGSNCLEGIVYPGQQLCWLRAQANDSTSPPPACAGKPYGQTPFTDICNSPFRDDIEWAYLNNITSGCAADRYCPSANVTRDQMASFLQRKYGFPSTTTNYFDDDNGNSHESNINRIAAAGVTSGCGTRKYCPANEVSRGQMASFLARASKLPAASKNYFTDDTGHPNESDINRIAEAGISSGCGLNKYCPDAIVTREQMAAFLRRAPKP